jgi:hypothetical protein
MFSPIDVDSIKVNAFRVHVISKINETINLSEVILWLALWALHKNAKLIYSLLVKKPIRVS